MNIGEKIKESRKNMGLSQEQLAEKLMVSRAAVAKWENDNGIPDIENLKKISEVFKISIDELVINEVEKKCDINKSDEDGYYEKYIGQKCNVEMSDWNDGIYDAYILNYDKKFVYYVKFEKKTKKIGALAKQYIEKVVLCRKKEKQEIDFTELKNIRKEDFLQKQVNIYLEDKSFFDGIFGKDTEILGTEVIDINEEYVEFDTGKKLEIDKVTKL